MRRIGEEAAREIGLKVAYLWEGGRDPKFSTIYGRMCYINYTAYKTKIAQLHS